MNLRTFGIRVGDNSTARGSKIVKFEDGSEISFSDSDFLPLESSDKTLYIGSSELSNGLLNSLGSVSYNGNVIRSVIELGSSGGCFPDQTELSWGELSEQLGIQIEEKTSLTKRVRRVFSFSNEQLKNSTMCCMPSHLSINFVNYLDRDIEGVSGNYKVSDLKNLWPKVYDFVKRVESEQYWSDKSHRAVVSLLGTGPKRRDMITLEQD
jgi:hypothetical protein